jgi:lysine 6-dehydrogenase
MKYLVLGSGMMGGAVAYDLATHNPSDEILLADINITQAKSTAKAIGENVRPIRVDVNNHRELISAMNGSAVVVSAVSYSVNHQISRAAIETGAHMVDLGGNTEIVHKQMGHDAEAKAKGVTIIPNSGLAPGLINVLAMYGSRDFDELDSIFLRVGGLPLHPRPPLYYQVVFSVEGLINEYVEQAEVIKDGKVEHIDPMSGLEDIEFPPPFGVLEAFNTSGGLSLMTHILEGKVKNLDYKTIRYKGHCEKFKTLLDLGFATSEPMMVGGSVKTNREFFADLLRKKLDYGDKDAVLARATITGRRQGAEKALVYEFIDYYDEPSRMTAMMRTTAFPTSIIAQMVARGTITDRGVILPELCVPGDALIGELAKRNIRIRKQITESWN